MPAVDEPATVRETVAPAREVPGAVAGQEPAAWVFPGQGSQDVGMGRDLCERSEVARAIFTQADEVLGSSLSELCFNGPEEELRRTYNAQPAILTASMACLRAAQHSGALRGIPRFVAGHSLGEYTALVAAGAMEFAEALWLVRERGRLMQEAGERNPGTMAAILGLDDAAVDEVCRETGAEICNLNGAGQVVIGGHREAVLRAMDLSRARGAVKAIELNVSGAFHSSLMDSAARGMQQALRNVHLRDPMVPVVANTTARPLYAAAELREELALQVTTAVHWRQMVEFMARSGVQTFIEIGPGRVLTGLIKRIAGRVNLRNLSNADAILKPHGD